MPTRDLTKEELEAALQANPDARYVDLKLLFRCGSSTIRREMARHGLKTKSRSERPQPWLEGDRHPLRRWHLAHPDFGEKQRGAANPVHKAKLKYDDPAYVANITRGIRAHVTQKTGRSYEEVYGEEQAASYKLKLREASPARMAKFFRKQTAPEKQVKALLGQLGVSYVEQAPIGYYTVDFLIPSLRLVVQADGDYWHAHPDKYPVPTQRQHKQRRLDASCDSFLHNQGYRVLRLWESDLADSSDVCLARLDQIIKDIPCPPLSSLSTAALWTSGL